MKLKQIRYSVDGRGLMMPRWFPVVLGLCGLLLILSLHFFYEPLSLGGLPHPHHHHALVVALVPERALPGNKDGTVISHS